MIAATAPAASRRIAGVYREVAVSSRVGGDASPHQLIAMLFDGLAEAIAAARGALRERRLEDKARAVTRAVRIVEEGLRASLDTRAGGALAERLGDLYTYIGLRLTRANLHNDEAALAECAALVEPLRDAWQRIAPPPATA